MGLFVWWFLLACLRVLLTLLPQYGYMHPDEFFQSVEIATGDMLEVESLRTWEFNSSFPIRSIVPVYLVSGPAMVLLWCLRSAGFLNIISSYTVLVMPRLVMLLLSVLIDLCVYRITELLGGNGKAGAILVASSYVTIVYYTRTFSNSFEGVLFAVLLLETLTVKSSLPSAIQRKAFEKDSHLRRRHDSVMVRGSAIRIALVIVLGLFNRPTFAAYAAVPYAYWVFMGNDVDRSLCAHSVFRKVLGSCISGVFFAAFFVLCDSVYFGRLQPVPGEIISTLQEVGVSDFALKNLTVTPLNFLLYNMQFNNLASHGIHPVYLHVVVNVQILFCILGIFAAKDLIRLAISVIRNGMLSVIDSVTPVVLLSYIVPLLFLSFFPHQEPRFIIPLLCPLAVLGTAEVFGSKSKKYITCMWIIFNVFGVVFFGFVHQGGVIRAISQLRNDAIRATHPQTTDVVFWRTYMPPRHLFLLNKHRVSTEPVYRVHDLAGASKERLFEFLSSVKNSSEGGVLVLITPGSLQREVLCFQDSVELQVMDRFWPHLSGEDLPTADLILCREKAETKCRSTVDCQSQCLTERIYNAFSLYLYRVSQKA